MKKAKAKAKPTTKSKPANDLQVQIDAIANRIGELMDKMDEFADKIDRLDQELKTKLAPMGISIDD